MEMEVGHISSRKYPVNRFNNQTFNYCLEFSTLDRIAAAAQVMSLDELIVLLEYNTHKKTDD